MSESNEIICIGEILWDALPSGLYLGGAPLNVCYHLNRLGIDAAMASKVGNDRLGTEALRQIKLKGIPSDHIQDGEKAETGFVSVELNERGDPVYEIIEPAAWDFVELTAELSKAVRNCQGLVFGTLAQRSETTRATIRELWDSDAMKIFDMNLRPPYVDREIVTESLEVAGVVKMNDAELARIKDWFTLPKADSEAMRKLVDRFEIALLCVTSSKDGAKLCEEGRLFEHGGFPAATRDAVGAGDAFLAALLYGISNGRSGAELLALSNAAGALVAQKDGATPDYTLRDVLNQMGSV